MPLLTAIPSAAPTYSASARSNFWTWGSHAQHGCPEGPPSTAAISASLIDGRERGICFLVLTRSIMDTCLFLPVDLGSKTRNLVEFRSRAYTSDHSLERKCFQWCTEKYEDVHSDRRRCLLRHARFLVSHSNSFNSNSLRAISTAGEPCQESEKGVCRGKVSGTHRSVDASTPRW